MLENFQLTAIVGQGAQKRLLRIPLHQALQAHLAEQWSEQYQTFIEDTEQFAFNPGYKPEPHERFRLNNYELPEWIADEDSQSVDDLDSLTEHDEQLDSVKGVVAFGRSEGGESLLLFQNFKPSHVIRPGRFLFLQNDTYESAQRPGLTLDDKLSAVYWPNNQTLLFHSFRNVNTFLPLADFYQEASEQEIRDILGHELLQPEDEDALAVNTNQWFRKRFAMLRDSGVLDNYTAEQIRDHSEGYEVDVQVEDDKIVFPAEKRQAKRLLQFLNEEIFRGAITETLYETNSKREADE